MRGCAYLTWCRKKPLCLLLWTYFLSLILPVSGLIQHGMVAKAADRYAYFPMLVFLPFLVSFIVNVAGHVDRPRQSLVLGCILGVLLSNAHISRNQLNTWRDEHTAYAHALALDPTDWRILDLYAEMMLANGDKVQANEYWNLTWRYAPKQGLKAVLLQAKVYLMTGNWDEACAIYKRHLEHYPDSVYILNNVGVCVLKFHQNRDEALKYILRAAEFSTTEEISNSVDENVKLVSNWDGVALIRPRLLY